jgi:hypothetical protein
MTLDTLGAVIKYALKLENAIKIQYEYAIENNIEKEFSSTFESKVSQSLKNIKKLKKVQRENTTEMILEPIRDFDEKPFEDIFQLDSKMISIEKLNENEYQAISFYEAAAKKVSFIREVSYIFEQLSLKHSVD